ncbi:MAG: hypothetical protein CVU55_15760 [Deltaproteobacteria bacterium HGW-Deltaproteobacteria-13]|jgi:c-di-GMP-binding flagellar brake protein YcgR|nr:MAG: hypothetical protein CVU55_15760 [Deltaproteobacteria bacterium HGW-Deltaproteobacteria-13]
MKEKRKARRLKDESEIAVTIVDDKKNSFKEKRFNSQSMNISVSGAKIKSSIPLPVNTFIMIKMKLKTLGKMINTLGKVKWTKGILENKSYEAGVEFVDIPDESIEYIQEYISRGVDRHDFTG